MPIRYVEKLAQVIAKLLTASATAWRWPGATATCPSGKKVIGGGGQCRSNTGFIWLMRSMPSGNNAWTASCDDRGIKMVQLQFTPFCQWLILIALANHDAQHISRQVSSVKYRQNCIRHRSRISQFRCGIIGCNCPEIIRLPTRADFLHYWHSVHWLCEKPDGNGICCPFAYFPNPEQQCYYSPFSTFSCFRETLHFWFSIPYLPRIYRGRQIYVRKIKIRKMTPTGRWTNTWRQYPSHKRSSAGVLSRQCD